MAILFSFFFDIDFWWILVPTWPQLGPQLGPQIRPQPLQEPSKILSKSHLIFECIFNRFLIDFGPQNQQKINQKSFQKSTQQPNSQNSKKYKKEPKGFLYFLLLRQCFVVYKMQQKTVPHSSKNTSQSNTPTWIDFGANLAPLWGRWEPRWGQIRTKSLQNSIFKSIKNDHIFDRFWERF